jgi:hypothetical protein
MITATILSILGVVLLIVLWMMMRSPSGAAAISAAKQAPQVQPPPPLELHPSEARVGDYISISGAAADFSDLDFTVDRRSAYQLGSRRWTDLSGEYRGDRVYLEAQPKPSAEAMGIFDPRKLTLADLHIDEQRLVELDNRQDPNQFISLEGKNWNFESSRELGYFENETGQGEGLYRWLFREQGGERLLCVEKWEGEPFDVRVARRVKVQDITVFRAA